MPRQTLHVLILDDDPDDTFLICDTIDSITASPYEHIVAHTPDDARALLKDHTFDIVLCDYRLGATSGIDFINSIRALGYTVPVILLTGMEDRSTDEEALAAGASDFISKSGLSSSVIDRTIRYAVANAERQQLLSTVLTSVNAAVCVLDRNGNPNLWNPSFGELACDAYPDEEEVDAVGKQAERLQTPENIHTIGERILDKKMSNLADNRQVITLHDVTDHIQALREREQAENRAAHTAKHCSLTGLPNRMAFAERLSAEIARADENVSEFNILNLDLDRFKEVNDVFGHHVGDRLLEEVTKRLRECLGPDDYLARLGGDEFVAIHRCDRSLDQIPELATKFAECLYNVFEIDNRAIRTGASVGVARYPIHGEDSETLLSNADAAMYRAKADPHAQIHCYDSALDQAIREKRIIATDLKEAIHTGQIHVHYQPQASLETGEVTGFEALARWTHPERGDISPGIFIPIAEEIGMIDRLGEAVLRRSCKEAMNWPGSVKVSVNISGIQIRYTDLVSIVHSTLLETGLPASRLELEVTESVLIDDLDHAVHVLRGIKNLGVSLAMDDFGTGYSSLSSLLSFPFDKLKIDQSFIRGLETGERMSAVIGAIIALGKNLDLKIIAEGVEEPAQVEMLQSLDCQEIQGFLLGRGMPCGEIQGFLQQGGLEAAMNEKIAEQKQQLSA